MTDAAQADRACAGSNPHGTGDDLLPIGNIADATGVAVSALRYYDEIGLISPRARIGGKRRFGPEAIGRVNFVRRAKKLGFSLDEVREILDDTSGEWAKLVADRLASLRQQRDELDAMIDVLEEVQACGCEVVAECPRTITVC